MTLSRTAKVFLALGMLLGLVVYLLIVDLGINAGKIHYGVTVGSVEVGGLTELQAAELLKKQGRLLKRYPVAFTSPGVNCDFLPRQLGWGPQPFDTAKEAMALGRAGSLITKLRDRLRAYEGVSLGWHDVPDPSLVDAFVSRCDAQVSALGQTVDDAQFRRDIASAITTFPRQPFNIPLMEARSL